VAARASVVGVQTTRTIAAAGSWSDRKRALYPGGRPSAAAKAVHRRFADGPIPRLVPTACVLEVLGRRSGRLVRVPLVIVRYRGDWYLASMFGDRANWVANVRAAGGRAVLVHGRRRAVRLVEVPAGQRAPILRRHLVFAPGARPHVPVRWHDPLPAFERIAADHPAFRVEPRT
jgi:deazaflavin-dependent oxidoreductase (nitroreductase family)